MHPKPPDVDVCGPVPLAQVKVSKPIVVETQANHESQAAHEVFSSSSRHVSIQILELKINRRSIVSKYSTSTRAHVVRDSNIELLPIASPGPQHHHLCL